MSVFIFLLRLVFFYLLVRFFLRIILMVWAYSNRNKNGSEAGISKNNHHRPKNHAFEDKDIVDAEFKEIE